MPKRLREIGPQQLRVTTRHCGFRREILSARRSDWRKPIAARPTTTRPGAVLERARTQHPQSAKPLAASRRSRISSCRPTTRRSSTCARSLALAPSAHRIAQPPGGRLPGQGRLGRRAGADREGSGARSQERSRLLHARRKFIRDRKPGRGGRWPMRKVVELQPAESAEGDSCWREILLRAPQGEAGRTDAGERCRRAVAALEPLLGNVSQRIRRRSFCFPARTNARGTSEAGAENTGGVRGLFAERPRDEREPDAGQAPGAASERAAR